MLVAIGLNISALLIVFVGVYLYLTWHHRYWEKRGTVTAQPLSLLGSYPSLLTGQRSLIHDIQDIYDKYKDKHRAVGVFITRQPQLLILDPQLAHDVLVNKFSDFRDAFTSTFMGNPEADKYAKRNPFFAIGDTWKKLRTDCGAGLTSNKIKQGYAIWERSGDKLISYIERRIEKQGEIIESRDISYRFTADVMADFIWGIDAETLTLNDDVSTNSSPFLSVTSNWTAGAFQNFTVYNRMIVAPVIRRIMRMRFYLKETDEFFAQMTKDAVKMRLSGGTTRFDFMSHLVQLMEQKGATNDDLVGHALTVLLDGFETSAAVLYHMLYTLSENRREQQKLRDEILDALNGEKHISYEKLTSLQYLDQCVHESLRLTSVIGTLTKICTQPTKIDLNNGRFLHIESGTSVLIPAYHYHHDEMYYPDPESFKPERFDNDRIQELIKNGLLLPFGDGPRICLGMRIGLLNVKTAILQIISQYEVIQTEKVPLSADSGLGLYLSGDINLKYKKLKA